MTNINSITNQLKLIIRYLEEMKPNKCDFNYQTSFSVIFKAINMIPNKEERKQLYLNLYLNLIYVFPEVKNYLRYQSKLEKLFQMIHKIRDQEKRYRYYRIITNNYTQFSHILIKDLIKIYNTFLLYYIPYPNLFVKYSDVLFKIISLFYNKQKEITQFNSQKGRNIEYPFLIQIIESFIVAFLIINLCGYTYFSFDQDYSRLRSNEIIKLMFPLYLDISSKYYYYDKNILFLLLCSLLLFWKGGMNEIEQWKEFENFLFSTFSSFPNIFKLMISNICFCGNVFLEKQNYFETSYIYNAIEETLNDEEKQLLSDFSENYNDIFQDIYPITISRS